MPNMYLYSELLGIIQFSSFLVRFLHVFLHGTRIIVFARQVSDQVADECLCAKLFVQLQQLTSSFLEGHILNLGQNGQICV